MRSISCCWDQAQKLATYLGWLMHGMRGGLAAGILFVPGAFVMLALSLLYAPRPRRSVVDGALRIKAAVLVIVIEALIRIGKRALKSSVLLALAAAAFVGIFFLTAISLIIAAAALIGYFVARQVPDQLGLTETLKACRHRQKTAGSISPLRRSSALLRGGCQSHLPSLFSVPSMFGKH
jgi:chromate transporter